MDDPSTSQFEREVMAYYLSILPTTAALEPDWLSELLRRQLESNLALCSPRNNGIVRVASSPVETSGTQPEDLGLAASSGASPRWSVFYLRGFDVLGKRPLFVQVGLEGNRAGLTLKMAAGKNADDDEEVPWLAHGTGPDNPVVMAVLLLSSLLFYASGYCVIFNEPLDDPSVEVRTKQWRRLYYRRMGFRDVPGEQIQELDLRDKASVNKPIRWVGRRLSEAGVDPARLSYGLPKD